MIRSKVCMRSLLGLACSPALVAAFYGCSSNSASPGANGNDAGGMGQDATTPDADAMSPGPDGSAAPDADAGVAVDASDGSSAIQQKVTQTKLFADTVDGGASNVDPNLLNSWGLAFNPVGVAWVADNHAGVATLYQTNKTTPLALVVQIPLPGPVYPAADAGTTAAPTGQVFNPSAAVPDAGTTGDFMGDFFILSTEDGTIAGWAPSFADRTKAQLRVDSSSGNAIYKGLAIVPSTPQTLVAADFHNGKIDVFDANYAPVTPASGKWVDSTVPAGYAPFNVVSIGTNVLVSYAMQDTAKQDDVGGLGHGVVSVFQTDGTFVKTLIPAGGVLNSPWAMTTVPAGGWGALPAGALLVGGFGNGAVNAYDMSTGAWIGDLVTSSGALLKISGLWALEWGPNAPEAGTTPDQLYFTAGPNSEANGLYGYLTVQ